MGLVLLFGINPYAKAQSPSEMFREHVPGAGLYNTGKAMVWTGAGIALSGGASVSIGIKPIPAGSPHIQITHRHWIIISPTDFVSGILSDYFVNFAAH